MGRLRNLIAVGALALTLAAGSPASAAESPQLYLASGEGYSIAFLVTGDKTSVIGLDAEVYCAQTEPRQPAKPSFEGLFPLPRQMTSSATGLTVTEAEKVSFGSAETSVTAKLEGGELVGEFTHREDEEYFHCSSGSGGEPGPVSFEAVRYVPTTDPAASIPAADEPDIYLDSEGPLQVFLRVEKGRVYVRGSIESSCRFKAGSATLHPLFATPTDPAVEGNGSFVDEARYKGRVGKRKRFFEPVALSAVVGADGVAGFYSRRRVTRAGAREIHRCGIGTQPFTAARYVPAAGPPPA